MSKSSSMGTSLKVGTGNEQKKVGGLTSINGIEITKEVIDVSALDNITGYREKVPGFKEVGDVTTSGFLDGDDAGQIEMYALLDSEEESDFEIVFPSAIGKKWSFKGYVIGFVTGADLGNGVTFEATIAVNGKPTLAAVTP